MSGSEISYFYNNCMSKNVILLLLIIAGSFKGNSQTIYTYNSTPGNGNSSQNNGNGGLGNAMNVNINNPLYFQYSTVQDMLQPQIINNALSLELHPRQHSLNVYAQINFNGSKHKNIPNGWLALRLINKTSPDAFASNESISLSESPVLLFTQPAGNSNAVYSFIYSAILNPPTKHIKPDNYSFSITFTLSQP